MIDLSSAYYHTEHVNMFYVSAPENWLEMQWKGHIAFAEVQEAMQKALKILKEVKSDKLLSDHRAVTNSWDSANRWIVERWLNDAQRLRLRYVAFVAPEELLPRISLDNLYRMLMRKRPELKENVRIFKEIEEARSWLRTMALNQ